MEKISFKISDKQAMNRLDSVTAEYLKDNSIEISRSALKSRDISILVNGKNEKAGYRVRLSDTITIEIPEIQPAQIVPQDLGIPILYCDADIAVINKPAGIVVHPSKGHENETIVNSLLYQLEGRLSSVGGIERPGIVHRLDKDTSGLLLIALNDHAHHKLTEDFKNRLIKKT